MKLDFKRYIMAILFAVMPVIILNKAIYIKLAWVSIIITVFVTVIFISLFNTKNKHIKIASIAVAILLLLLTNRPSLIYEGIKAISKRYTSLIELYNSKQAVELMTENIKSVNTVVRLYFEIMIPSLFVVYKNKLWKMVYLDVTIPFIILILAVGLTPSTLDVYIFSFMYTNLAIEKNYKKREMDLNTNRSCNIKNAYVNVIMLIVFLIITVINAVNPYKRDEKMDEYKETLNGYLSGERSFIEDIKETFNFNNGNIGAGGMNNGKLGTVDQLKFTGEEKLRLSLSRSDFFYDDKIYIKSYVGSIYTGNSWENADSDINNAVIEIQNREGISMSEVDEISNTFLKYSDNYRISYGYNGEIEKMEITNLDKRNNNVFWPYYCQTGLESKSDGQRKNTDNAKNWIYERYVPLEIPSTLEWMEFVDSWGKYPAGAYSIYDSGDESGISQLAEAEDVLNRYYANVATKYYLEIPESFKQTGDRIFGHNISDYLDLEKYFAEYLQGSQNYIDYDGFAEKYNTANSYEERYDEIFNNLNKKIKDFPTEKYGYEIPIEYVKEYLNKTCEYSLEPGKLKNGEDFVNKFLNETKKGYCTHFASAAVLMFRYMGIPARYVEGYVCDNLEISTDKILKDDSAHAWVEIFVKGMGWMAVDVTPSNYRKIIREGINNNYATKNNNNDTNDQQKTTAESEIKQTTSSEETTKSDSANETTSKTSGETATIKNTGGTGTDSGNSSGSSTNISGKFNKSIYIMLCVILLIVTLLTAFGMIYANGAEQQKKYLAVLKGSDKEKIYNICLEQLRKWLEIKKVDLNLFESREMIIEKIMKADAGVSKEDAAQLADIIVKGQYSQKPLGDEEITRLVRTVGEITKHIYTESSFARKLNLYYIKCLYLSKK